MYLISLRPHLHIRLLLMTISQRSRLLLFVCISPAPATFSLLHDIVALSLAVHRRQTSSIV